MDYYLTLSENDLNSVLHKSTCLKLNKQDSAEYVGYFWGDYNAIQKAIIISPDKVVLCPLCMDKSD